MEPDNDKSRDDLMQRFLNLKNRKRELTNSRVSTEITAELQKEIDSVIAELSQLGIDGLTP